MHTASEREREKQKSDTCWIYFLSLCPGYRRRPNATTIQVEKSWNRKREEEIKKEKKIRQRGFE
jgi:hypothetical protein